MAKRMLKLTAMLKSKECLGLSLLLIMLKFPDVHGFHAHWTADQSLYPPAHVKYHRNAGLSNGAHCPKNDSQCEDGDFHCWGYETGCTKKNRFSMPVCIVERSAWAKTNADHVELFWSQADFGYIKSMLTNVMDICTGELQDDSSLRCVNNMRFCHATNLYMDFREINFEKINNRFGENLFQKGQIGGHCTLDQVLLSKQGGDKSPLQSWYAELEQYSSLPWQPTGAPYCDITIDTPAYLIKLDAGINMYHHFCDFVNLYASQHINGSFSTDAVIYMWDTSNFGYGDFFAETWKAFSRYPIRRLNELQGKRVCFKDAVFPLLARMIRGLYYNMPLVTGCKGSGLIKAFSEHVLHHLNVSQDALQKDVFRVTLLSRNTKYRNILNEDELLGALKQVPGIVASKAILSREMPFVDQLKISHNTDLFIGMHGAGLTHALFLPDWGALFELYNTEDPDCYKDLSRLRGIDYITWQRKEVLFQQDKGHHPTLGEHPKFTNYAFNVDEFMRFVIDELKQIRKKKHKYYSKQDS